MFSPTLSLFTETFFEFKNPIPLLSCSPDLVGLSWQIEKNDCKFDNEAITVKVLVMGPHITLPTG